MEFYSYAYLEFKSKRSYRPIFIKYYVPLYNRILIKEEYETQLRGINLTCLGLYKIFFPQYVFLDSFHIGTANKVVSFHYQDSLYFKIIKIVSFLYKHNNQIGMIIFIPQCFVMCSHYTGKLVLITEHMSSCYFVTIPTLIWPPSLIFCSAEVQLCITCLFLFV